MVIDLRGAFNSGAHGGRCTLHGSFTLALLAIARKGAILTTDDRHVWAPNSSDH